MFKKRSGTANKKTIRKAGGDSGNDTDDDNIVDISEIKLQQNMRSRTSGTALESLFKKRSTNAVSDDNSQSDKTVVTVLGTQFSVQSETSLQSGTIHEKMMEKYIDDKLGVNDESRYWHYDF